MQHFQKVYVEIGNICNLQCSFCPEVKRKKLRIQEEALRRTLSQVQGKTHRICFHVMGEPLAHPEFPHFVNVASEYGIPVEITTNGTLLNASTEKALLEPIICQVNFSLQSFPDNFQAASPDGYLRKIFAFTRNALESRPDLYINYRLWNLESDSFEANEYLLSKIENEFQISVTRKVNPRMIKSKKLFGRLYLHFDTRFRWPNMKDKEFRAKGTCHGLKSHVAIHADGTIVPCCLDKEADIILGNIHTTDFESVLKSSRAQALRKGFDQGELVESLCRRCQFATRFG